jgi:hypothetical protein
MTNTQENPGAQRTRRNIMKMGAILSFAALPECIENGSSFCKLRKKQ